MKLDIRFAQRCRLVLAAQRGSLTEDTLELELSLTDEIEDTGDFYVALVACRHCGLRFVHCFHRYSVDEDADCWSLWFPVREEDIERVGRAEVLMRLMSDWAGRRPLIGLHPDGHVLWAEEGLRPAAESLLP